LGLLEFFFWRARVCALRLLLELLLEPLSLEPLSRRWWSRLK
jgi:hypothetical protein